MSTRTLLLCLSLAFLGPGLLFGAVDFFSPELVRATPSELSDRIQSLTSLQNQNPDLNTLLLTRLFLADAQFAAGEVHAATKQYGEAGVLCDRLEDMDYQELPDPGRAAAVCVLVYGELLASRDSLTGLHWLLNLKRARLREASAKLSQMERWYLEGRLFASLPPGWGQDFKKALVALRSLQEMRPQDPSVFYWSARAYEWQGNGEMAQEMFEKASRMQPPDPRARAVQDRSQSDGGAPDADGLRYGFRPGLFYSQARGLGLQLGWADERMFDTAREIAVTGEATTRGQFGFDLSFADGALYRPVKIVFDGSYFQGAEDFFGVGIQSGLDAQSDLNTRRTDIALKAVVPFYRYFSLSAGWRYAGADAPQGAPVSFGFANGPFGELAVDTRDSRRNPLQGGKFFIRGYFPTQGLGSDRTLQEWTVAGQYHQRLALRHAVSVFAGAVLLNGDAVYPMFPALGGSLPSPGVRQGRFRDRSLASASLEYRWRIFQLASLAAFASMGTVCADSSLLLQSQWKAGGGVAWIGHLSRYRSADPRVELALFGGEIVFQAGITARW